MFCIKNNKVFLYLGVLLTSFIFLFLPIKVVLGQIIITEIMYDLEGSDNKKEWIEIQNIGKDPISIEGWKLFEGETNHKIKIISGSYMLLSETFAIIADNPDSFLKSWPGYSGTLFDSSFLLNNTGEEISIRNSELVDIDSVSYLSEWGGDGNGDSIQKFDKEWVSSPPTPGLANVITIIVEPKEPVKEVFEPVLPTPSPIVEEVVVPEVENIPLFKDETEIKENFQLKSENNKTNNLFKWLSILFILIVISIAGVMVRKPQLSPDDAELIEKDE